MQALTRRQFLQTSGAATATGALTGLGLDLTPLRAEAQVLRTREAKEVPTVCMYCAVRCGQLAAVENGRIINNEECYLITKFARALGVVSLEHQARI